MTELRVNDSASRRLNPAVTVIIIVAGLGVAYWCDRAYGRWVKAISPLAGPRARVVRMRVGYQDRRATATDTAQIIGAVLDEVARATATAPRQLSRSRE